MKTTTITSTKLGLQARRPIENEGTFKQLYNDDNFRERINHILKDMHVSVENDNTFTRIIGNELTSSEILEKLSSFDMDILTIYNAIEKIEEEQNHKQAAFAEDLLNDMKEHEVSCVKFVMPCPEGLIAGTFSVQFITQALEAYVEKWASEE